MSVTDLKGEDNGFSSNLVETAGVDSDLSRKSIQGGFWVFSLQGISRLFQFVRTLILANLLSPNDFGLFGVAVLSLSFLDVMSQTGLKSAVIQKKENPIPYLDTVWTVSIIRGVVITGILFLLAPIAAEFFATPDAVPLIRVIGLSFVLASFRNTGVLTFVKDMQFRKFCSFQITGIAAEILVSLIAAFVLRNAWALVFGMLALSTVTTIASFLFHDYRPRLSLDMEKARELFTFGKWILGSGIMYFIAMHLDDVLVGYVLGAASLGLYQLAFRISSMPATEITNVAYQVVFPAFAKIQDQPVRLRAAYFRTLQFIIAGVMPMTAGIICLAPEFIRIVLGEPWIPMTPAVQLLAVAGMLRAVSKTGSALFASSGVPRYQFYLQLVRNGILLIVVYPLILYWGLSGAAWAVVLATASMGLAWLVFTSRVISAPWKEYIRVVFPPLISSAVMALILLAPLSTALFREMTELSAMAVLVGASIVGALAYTGCLMVCQRFIPKYNVLDEINQLIQSFRPKNRDGES